MLLLFFFHMTCVIYSKSSEIIQQLCVRNRLKLKQSFTDNISLHCNSQMPLTTLHTESAKLQYYVTAEHDCHMAYSYCALSFLELVVATVNYCYQKMKWNQHLSKQIIAFLIEASAVYLLMNVHTYSLNQHERWKKYISAEKSKCTGIFTLHAFSQIRCLVC